MQSDTEIDKETEDNLLKEDDEEALMEDEDHKVLHIRSASLFSHMQSVGFPMQRLISNSMVVYL